MIEETRKNLKVNRRSGPLDSQRGAKEQGKVDLFYLVSVGVQIYMNSVEH
jgi:hypothetical protein